MICLYKNTKQSHIRKNSAVPGWKHHIFFADNAFSTFQTHDNVCLSLREGLLAIPHHHYVDLLMSSEGYWQHPQQCLLLLECRYVGNAPPKCRFACFTRGFIDGTHNVRFSLSEDMSGMPQHDVDLLETRESSVRASTAISACP